jgi:hypothetical protein
MCILQEAVYIVKIQACTNVFPAERLTDDVILVSIRS